MGSLHKEYHMFPSTFKYWVFLGGLVVDQKHVESKVVSPYSPSFK